MSADAENSKRYVGGPRAVGSVLPPLLRPAYRRRSPLGAQIMADWPAIVGPALAAVTEPSRLSGSTLTVTCAGPVALELQHMTAELLARINGHLGRVAVERLRFTQAVAAGLTRPTALPPPAAARPAAVPGLPAGRLHDALARLGGAVAAKQRL